MATVDMNDIFPEGEEHNTKKEEKPETIVVNPEDVTVEDAPGTEKKTYLDLFKKNPRVANAVKYMVEQIIRPSVLGLASKILHSMVDFIIYDSPRRSRDYDGSGYDYNRQYRTTREEDPFDNNPDYDVIYEKPYRTSKNESFGLHKYGFATRESAEHCLEELRRMIQLKGYVTVEYYFKYIGRSSPKGTMCYHWGWVNLDGVPIVSVHNGYKIRFPEVVSIG